VYCLMHHYYAHCGPITLTAGCMYPLVDWL